MKERRILVIRFTNELAPWEVSAFRGAVIEKVGREHLLFNHHLDDQKYLYRYPLIQYKSISGKPGILCLGEGVDEIHKLFSKTHWDINLKGEKTTLEIDEMQLKNFSLTVGDKAYNYRLNNWLGLNKKNFLKYKSLTNTIDQTEFLEKILIGNILSFAKGMEWQIKEEVKVRLRKIHKTKNLKYKNTHLLAFNLEFSSNVFLPDHIGLGKGVSHGYGMLTTLKNNNQ